MRRLFLLLFGFCLAAAASGQTAHQRLLAGQNESIVPRYVLQDPRGRAVSNDDFRGRFQLIAFGYTFCPDICPTTLVDMAAVLARLGDKAARLQAIFITVDPERDSGEVLQTYTAFFDRRILGLTGPPALIRRAADNFRIRYAKVIDAGNAPENYAVDHSAGMILLGPDGGFIEKFAYATPVDTLVDALSPLLATP
ncbi:MAG: SCO family protein [Azonexus sp.]|jgi:protein SCO1/2|nr:SCO family protein [Azonexus sp.]